MINHHAQKSTHPHPGFHYCRLPNQSVCFLFSSVCFTFLPWFLLFSAHWTLSAFHRTFFSIHSFSFWSDCRLLLLDTPWLSFKAFARILPVFSLASRFFQFQLHALISTATFLVFGTVLTRDVRIPFKVRPKNFQTNCKKTLLLGYLIFTVNASLFTSMTIMRLNLFAVFSQIALAHFSGNWAVV